MDKRVLLFLTLVFFLAGGGVAASTGGVVLGGNVVILEGEQVVGDQIVCGGEVKVLGEVTGNLVCIGGNAFVEGTVGGDLIAIGATARLGEDSYIKGNFVNIGSSLTRLPGSRIDGSLQTITIRRPFVFPQFFRGLSIINVWGLTISFFYMLFITLLVAFFFHRNVQGVAVTLKEEWGMSLLVGFVAVLVLLPLTILLVITIIGIPLTLLVAVLYWLAVLLGQVSIYYLLGQWGLRVAKSEMAKTMSTAIIGLIILYLFRLVMRFIPYIGGVITTVTMLLVYISALGAAIRSRFGTGQPWFSPKT